MPQEGDAVLGGTCIPPAGSLVLGGLAGVQQRLQSAHLGQRLTAIAELPRHGAAGLEVLIHALQDESTQVQKAAFLLLRHQQDPQARQALRHYDRYRLFECLHSLQGHRGGITAVALSPDGKTIISAGRDATLRVWDLPTQEEVMTLQTDGFVYAIAISPDHCTFTVKGKNQTIRAWDLRTGHPVDPDEMPTRTISSVTVSPDRHRSHRHLISGSQNTIKIWDLQTGRAVVTLQGHTSLVTAVAVAAQRSILVSGSEDRTVRIWGI